MTVAELIEKLKEVDQSTKVLNMEGMPIIIYIPDPEDDNQNVYIG